MDLRDFYEGQRKSWGNADGERGRKVADLYRRHLGGAQRLLDIGCGPGIYSIYLQTILGAKEVFGVDIAETRVAAACQRGVQAVQADMNKDPLPFEDDSFDAIFCGEIIEHLVDPDHLLDEIGRTLSPKGVCILTTPNLAAWVNRVTLLFGWQPFLTAVSFRHEVGRPRFLSTDEPRLDHLRVFTCKALEQLLRLHHFRILETRGVSLMDVFDISSIKSTRGLVARVLSPFDSLLSRAPSLSIGVAVAFGKGSTMQVGSDARSRRVEVA